MSSTYRKKLAFRAEKIPYSQSSTISRRDRRHGSVRQLRQQLHDTLGLLVISGSAA